MAPEVLCSTSSPKFASNSLPPFVAVEETPLYTGPNVSGVPPVGRALTTVTLNVPKTVAPTKDVVELALS